MAPKEDDHYWRLAKTSDDEWCFLLNTRFINSLSFFIRPGVIYKIAGSSEVDWTRAIYLLYDQLRICQWNLLAKKVIVPQNTLGFINTKKPSKIYTCFILRRFGLFLINLQSKNKPALGNASNSKPKDSVTQEITMWRKDVKSKSKTANHVKIATSKSKINSYAENSKTKPM